MTFTRLAAAVTIGAVAWHIKPSPTARLLSSMVEEEAAGRKDVFCSLRRQEELKMGMVSGDPWSC